MNNSLEKFISRSGFLVSNFSIEELQALHNQFSKYDIDHSNSIDISEFVSLVQNANFKTCVGGDANFCLLSKSMDLSHEVFEEILKQKASSLLLFHEEKGHPTSNATMTQEQMSMSYDPSLTYVEFVKGVLLLRNKIEARREQLRNPFVSKLQKVDKYLGKYQRVRKNKNVCTFQKGMNVVGLACMHRKT
jgi:hypothetical protein